jgi:hypothetical protein
MLVVFLRTLVSVVFVLVVFYAAARIVTGLWGTTSNSFDPTQIGTVQMKPGVTYEQFQQVQTGMTLAAVAAIFGTYGMNTSNQQAGLAGVVPNPDMVDYSWPGNQPLSRVLISFRQGKVSEKFMLGWQPLPGHLQDPSKGPFEDTPPRTLLPNRLRFPLTVVK